MLPWILFSSIYYVYMLCFVFPTFISGIPRECNCYFTEEDPGNHTELIHLLKCQRGPANQVPCQRINDLIRIGPVESPISVTSIQGGFSLANRHTIKLAPWAFADLLADGSVRHLQLDLHLAEHYVDALSLAGLNNLHSLMARTSVVQWDSCSFMGMPNLSQVLFNCKSNFREFITFGSRIRDVRFLDCEDIPLQFYCISCSQNPKVKVIRILPGPPLRQYMVKFSQFEIPSNPKAVSLLPSRNPLPIGKCIQNVCSDEMLCRDNMPLKQAQANFGRPITELSTPEPVHDSNTTDSEVSSQSSPASTLPSTARTDDISSNNRTMNPEHFSWKTYFTERTRIWITISIVSVIILLLFTLCILISMTRQRNRKHRVKFTPGRACPSHSNCNGTVNQIQPVMLTKETKLEQTELPA